MSSRTTPRLPSSGRTLPVSARSTLSTGWVCAAFTAVACLGVACSKQEPSAASPAASAAASASASAPGAAPAPTASAPSEPPRIDPKRYTWLGAPGVPQAESTLLARFPSPPGYARMDVSADSFGGWLRELPLAAPKTPVLSTRGAELFPGEHDYVAGVVAIDAGKTDVQQSSEAVTRLHAEWMFARGRRDLSYLAATKDELPYEKWTRGMRVTAAGAKVFWVKKTKASDPNDRAELRAYLDTVFAWGNSASVRLQSDPVEADKLAPGDFFLKNDKSGHAVIVLDIAKKPTGERVALLGHVLPSASSLYVLRLGPSTPWFSVRPPEAMLVPHAPKLEWSELRRLRDVPKPEKR